ncbi:chemotaxis protein CheX [bacterium]|nr:chemotaxis protein CheX [bacterium]MBU1072628.1 chemotaxis protein CheX [bacterium]MBU1675540.1 chemotaxis protein CheX [bacterium]
MIESLARDVSQELPADGLTHATEAVIETCDVQLGWSFAPADGPAAGPATSPCCGSAIALTSDDGTWLLIALCDLDSARRLTRALFAMDDYDDVMIEDTADALNEIMNVSAGVFKSHRDRRGEKLSIGLPTYLDGDETACRPSDRVARSSRLLCTDDDACIRVIAFWREGSDSGRLHA